MKISFKLLATAMAALLPSIAMASDVAGPTKAAPMPYQYPTKKCGLYYGINTMGSTGSVANAQVGTQVVQGDLGIIVGYTCPAGTLGYWFVDGSFNFANFNGSNNGFAVTGPAAFEQRFGFGAPVDMLISMVPGLSSLQNALPSLTPLPQGVAVVTSSPYLFVGLHEEDVSLANGFGANKEWLVSTGFGLGNKVRLSNGVVFDPYVEYILPSTEQCFGRITGAGCTKQGSRMNVGMALEF